MVAAEEFSQSRKLRRITAGELAIGTVLPRDISDITGKVLARRGETISSRAQINTLIEHGLFVEDETPPPTAPVVPRSTSAVALILEARRQLEVVCSRNASGGFKQQILEVRRLIAEACSLSQEVSLATALLHRQGRYSIRHSVDVAVACQVVGTNLQVGEPDLTSIVAAALTMNINMLELQDTLELQHAPLTGAQREHVQQHPAKGEAYLRELGVDDEVWLHAVLCHHEAIDGTGYGRPEKGGEVPIPAQFISLADVYCARISSRATRRAMRPSAVLKALFLDQGKKVRSGLASQFIKAVGVFPPGTPVRLQNGEIAVVTRRGDSTSQPEVCAVVRSGGTPHLSPVARDTSQPQFAVREVLDWSALGAPPSMESVWGKVAALGPVPRSATVDLAGSEKA
jgi:HD-GYP domain-containing protein (c-di-GMP phosphodiesterase class II)